VPSDRDERGIPRRGSAAQLAYYVNCAPDVLTAAVAAAGGPAVIDWRSPLVAERFEEYKDRDFLRAVDEQALSVELLAWWPDSGPRWDALGRAAAPGAVVLVEAKANIPEIANGPPCGSGQSGSERALDNRGRIVTALTRTREQFGVSERYASAWMETHCYQYANRLAHLCFFTRQRIPAVLVHLYFLNDTTHIATAATQFHEQRIADREIMGLAGIEPADALDVYLPAVPAAYERLRALPG
jgi:hypothetical protein